MAGTEVMNTQVIPIRAQPRYTSLFSPVFVSRRLAVTLAATQPPSELLEQGPVEGEIRAQLYQS